MRKRVIEERQEVVNGCKKLFKELLKQLNLKYVVIFEIEQVFFLFCLPLFQ